MFIARVVLNAWRSFRSAMWLGVHLCQHIALLRLEDFNQSLSTKHKDQSPKTKGRSSFHTDNLLDLSDNFNQVVLVLHYRLN
jgi:hypothetical protein